MLSVSSAQLDVWLALFVFPLSRILGLISMAPIFNNVGMPALTRLMVGLAVTFSLAPALPVLPVVAGGSWIGLAMVAEQTLIGILMGMALRIAFAAVDVAGELIGLQMGLSFAVAFDPINGGSTPVIAEFLGLFTSLIFLAMNGHLLALTVLAESFTLLPVTTEPFQAIALSNVVAFGATLFSTGVLLALPLITALLVTNLALGVLARIAQQLNLFAIGFPVTLGLGFVVLLMSLPYIGSALEGIFTQGFNTMELVLRSARV